MQNSKTIMVEIAGRTVSEEQRNIILKHCAQNDMKPEEYFEIMAKYENKPKYELMNEKKNLMIKIKELRQARTKLVQQLYEDKCITAQLKKEIAILEDNNQKVKQTLDKLQNNSGYCTII